MRRDGNDVLALGRPSPTPRPAEKKLVVCLGRGVPRILFPKCTAYKSPFIKGIPGIPLNCIDFQYPPITCKAQTWTSKTTAEVLAFRDPRKNHTVSQHLRPRPEVFRCPWHVGVETFPTERLGFLNESTGLWLWISQNMGIAFRSTDKGSLSWKKMVEQNMFHSRYHVKKSDRDVLHDVFLLRSSFGTPKKKCSKGSKDVMPWLLQEPTKGW